MKKSSKKLTDTAQAAPDTVILAADEASLYLQATLQIIWHPRGQTPVVRLHPGRQSTHFYGALNLSTGQETAMRSVMLNAEVSLLYLLKLLDTYPDRPILLFWDRTPWHRGTPIQPLLAVHPRLETVYLPTAAPNLNPQEHVWKATPAAFSHNHRYVKLEPLAAAFAAHLTSTIFPCSLLDQHNYHYLCAMSN